MQVTSIIPLTKRPPVVIAALAVVAVLGFVLVSRLANRFAEQQKALARHLYGQGLTDLGSAHPDRAIEEFRAALLYDRDNFDYQLSLARALRDTGRTTESESYLVSLWERNPQNAAVNLALGRLAARQAQLDKAIQYYHNAIYGVWNTNPDTNRINTSFELIEFLLREKANPQAQAELITLAAGLPKIPEMQLRAANLFARADDYQHALTEYDRVLQLEHNNPIALLGAGESAFKLARYRTAEHYLQNAAKAGSQDPETTRLLDLVTRVLAVDPLFDRLPASERYRRMRDDFEQAGKRLDTCQAAAGSNLPPAPQGSTGPDVLPSLKSQWTAMKPKLNFGRSDPDLLDSAMDLVFQIEQQTAANCGPPTGVDEALLLLSQNPGGTAR